MADAGDSYGKSLGGRLVLKGGFELKRSKKHKKKKSKKSKKRVGIPWRCYRYEALLIPETHVSGPAL